jgi:hypothetical protein
MTTAAQVKKLVRPLLERHSDLALVGRWIFVKPVHHFARGILLGRMLDAEKFRPQWAVVHLFEWQRFFPLSWGEWLYNKESERPGSWRISDADIASALFREIEEEALPALRAMKTLDDYLSYVSGHYFRHHLYDWPDCRIIVETALGDLKAARATGEANLAIWSRTDPYFDEETLDKYRRLRELCARLVADDRPGLVQMLHEWEASTAKNLKIEHIWQPTPFPFELQTTTS